jgi:hypothetical protein
VVEVFGNADAQFASILFGGSIVVIGLLTATDPGSRWLGAFYIGVGLVFGVRGSHGSSVVVTDEAVEMKSAMRTKRFPIARLTGVEVRVGQTGLTGFGREYLVLHLADGSTYRFNELNAKPSSDGSYETGVRQAAASIERALGSSHP